MATSGVDTWNPYLIDIIRQALLNATAVDETEEPSADQYLTALRQLNGLVKTIEATGAHVWTEEEAVLFLQPGQGRYVIGGAAADNTADAEDWILMDLTAPAAAAATTITVDDVTGVASGMNIGITLVDGSVQWTTVSGAPVGSVITLAAGLTAGASAGALVTAYTTKISRALKVPTARLLTLAAETEIPMRVMSRQEYMDLPNKASPGVPTQFFYSPQRDTGLFYVWPLPSAPLWAVRFTWYRPLQDFLTPEDTGDFPQEWFLPLMWALAKEVAPSYGLPEMMWRRIVEMADQYSLLVVNYDRESEPIQFGMDYPDGGR